MLAWTGAIFLVGAATWAGFEYSRQLDMRPKQIRQLKNALQILEAEIVYSQTPLQQAFHRIARQVPEPTASLFQNLAESLLDQNRNLPDIWCKHVEDHCEVTALGPNEKEVLVQFGRTLGMHELQQQKKQLLLASSHLERELEEARSRQDKYGNMAKMLGFLAGLFILLLFI
ncbi:stage III sporulation protein SpoIIIAB [Aciduricibacillus chroicocephali]|uniref:Stage III sporulation protein SpoIIIAB n=1 Tax=Aciduricibacillus chroicocephali TaxID=3054939 RepID=A0ABY9KTE8_9BACI|nr:stage III sporulation protein SpoIIIAB [Bacillaceae bacterium 44XB]